MTTREIIPIEQLPPEWRALLMAATEARNHAYAPYSGFPVGAAVQTAKGRIFAGCNVENASSGLTVCAERIAIFSAVASGERTITALAVVTEPGATPCGACRQVMSEFATSLPVLIADTNGHAWITSLEELLPEAFPRVNLEDLVGQLPGSGRENDASDRE